MGFFEKLLRGFSGSYRSDHHGRDGRRGHHGWGNAYPSHSAPTIIGPAGDSSCPKCGSATAPEGRYCAQCGTNLAPGNCASCNASLAPGSKFCPSCGKAC
ncbi:zinc ribbon domain-containing protein [Dechloromonas sp. ARDL1]|uniref:zinc ribbon domain-containing protein n=1 Tax=Dechloromonas sp. ARDL1 TaxID=3322121 RepID=UPI003DA75D76